MRLSKRAARGRFLSYSHEEIAMDGPRGAIRRMTTTGRHGRLMRIIRARRSEEHTSELQSLTNLVCLSTTLFPYTTLFRSVNLLATRKREHSRKPDEQYEIIEACSPGPFLELFARGNRNGWATWGNQAHDDYRPTWKTYAHHSRAEIGRAHV